MAISTNTKPKIYRNLYDNTVPAVGLRANDGARGSFISCIECACISSKVIDINIFIRLGTYKLKLDYPMQFIVHTVLAISTIEQRRVVFMCSEWPFQYGT